MRRRGLAGIAAMLMIVQLSARGAQSGVVAAPGGTIGRLLEVNHRSIYYETHGVGSPIVLLPGGGDSFDYSFGKVARALSRHHQIIAIEQTGQGHSPEAPGNLTYAAMMEDTSALLRVLNVSSADIVGWSDGGIVALMLAGQQPSQVRRVVASGANFSPDGIRVATLVKLKELSAREIYDVEEWSEMLRLNPGGEKQALSVAAKLKKLWLTSPTTDELSPEILNTVGQRVMVMAGDHDSIRVEHTIQIFQALPKAFLWIVPNCGHNVFNEHPDLAQRVVLEFLGEP